MIKSREEEEEEESILTPLCRAPASPQCEERGRGKEERHVAPPPLICPSINPSIHLSIDPSVRPDREESLSSVGRSEVTEIRGRRRG